MNRSLLTRTRKIGLALAILSAPPAIWGQMERNTSSVEGRVRDAENQALASATVVLESVTSGLSTSTTTNAQGYFRFSGIPAGTYRLRAKYADLADALEGPFPIAEKQSKSVMLHLRKANTDPSGKAADEIPFSDEAHFTVAGVTDTTSLGGHGSDPARRNSDMLSRDTAKLANGDDAASVVPGEARLREQLEERDNADLRFQLAEAEEKSGRSLEAVNDYERVATMDPTEPHLFAWGAELLLHRAFEPSIEIFTKGRSLYPASVRMVLGLGSATYAKGLSEPAMKIFLEACDMAPAEQTPYLFLGKVQKTETVLPDGWAERLKRFVDIHPENSLAHYYYAVALIKKSADPGAGSRAEAQLHDAIQLDPHLGEAYLELGSLASKRGDTADAIAYFEQAIANTPLPDDAHYRLAQVYRRLGDTEAARRESEKYKEINKKKQEQVERERRELQQFVFELREQKPSQNAPGPK